MSEYYINKETDESNARQIHRDDCSLLPKTPAYNEGLKYLGSYGSKDAAYAKARGYFESVAFCPSCLG
ncbi:hypothetical protein [Sessilibacter corallicola]|uniref:hypothetical protein n=1 Tax=Sessilibacter corallicola TaxID=2904075 RepID=UPI001E4B4ECE|nr:hypothetical protein [Sessilibacter corallicola]MCE2029647.1 hypothetical protein [Sessilibacter corallicola]